VLRLRVIQTYWLAVFVLIAVLMITACGGGDESTPTQNAGDEGTSGSGGSKTESTNTPESIQATATPTVQGTATRTKRTDRTGGSGSGNGNLSLDDALDRSVELYGRLLDILAGVTDEASAQTAVAELTDVMREFEVLGNQLEDYSDLEIASAAFYSRFYDLGQRFSSEVTRVMLNPATARILGEAFSELEGTGTRRVESRSRSTSTPLPSQIPGAGTIPIREPVETLNLSLRLSFSGLPLSYQECFRDGFNSLGLDIDSWQRAEFDVTLEQYNELLLVCALEGTQPIEGRRSR